MYIIDVIPIVRSSFKEELSYFARHDIPEGSLVSIPLRKRSVKALVVGSRPVKDAKAVVKTSDFQMRKLSHAYRTILLPQFIQTARYAAHYYATSQGSILFATIPKIIREQETIPAPKEQPEHTPKTKNKPLILQAPTEKRLEEYRNLARSSFVKKKSIIILTSSIQEAEAVANALTKGIGNYLYLFHSGIAKNEVVSRWHQALANDHAIVAVMTGGFLSLPRHDIGTIIIEREQSSSYKQHVRPFLDMRMLAEWYVKALDCTLIRADQPLRVDSIHHYKEDEYDSMRDVPTRIASSAHAHLVDMRLAKSDTPRQPFAVIGIEALNALKASVEEGKKCFLFAARRGIAPVTVCNDCGTRVSCLSCGAPVVLHRSTDERSSVTPVVLFAVRTRDAKRVLPGNCRRLALALNLLLRN